MPDTLEVDDDDDDDEPLITEIVDDQPVAASQTVTPPVAVLAADSTQPAVSKTEESLRVRGNHSYYYAWVETNRRRQADGLAPMPLPMPPKIASAAVAAIVPVTRTELVSRGPGEDWVSPPMPGGWMLAQPAPAYTVEQLYEWANWVSPPRGWPYTFTTGIPALKEFVSTKLAGKRVRMTEPAHAMEVARMAELGVVLSEKDAKANAIAVRRALGWEVVSGFALLELAQGCGRRDPVEKPVYHGERYYWNVTPKGLWVDLTPRTHHRKLVLVESAKTEVPPRSVEEAASCARAAERADEVVVDFQVDEVLLRGLRLTEKALDSEEGTKPILFLDACLHAIEKPYRAAKPKRPLDKHALRRVTLDGADVPRATSTPVRQLLRVDANDPTRRLCVALEFYDEGSPQAQLLKWATLHAPRLREAATLCLSKMSASSAPLGAAEMRVLAGMGAELAPLAVKTLHLDGNGFGDGGLALLLPLVRSAMPQLERLVLHSNDITNEGAAALAATPPRQPLLELDLSQNAIGDAGLAALMAALADGSLSVLESLDLIGNAASDMAIDELKTTWKTMRRNRRGRP